VESNLEQRNEKGVKVGAHEKKKKWRTKDVSNAERGKKGCLSSICVSMRVTSEHLELNRNQQRGVVVMMRGVAFTKIK
jgi:hypothetical protein